MNRKYNPTAIGAFMIVGILLGLVGLVLFSSADLFAKKRTFVAYFDQKLSGLEKGAAVKMRGVTIGEVKEILVHFNQKLDDIHMPILIEVNERMVQDKTDRTIALDDDAQIKKSVDAGMRAILETESLLTGRLYVNLDWVENPTPPAYHQLVPVYPELPTHPTQLAQLLKNLAQLDLKGVTDKLDAILANLDESLSELNMRDINASLTNLLTSADNVLRSPEITNAVTSARLALDEIKGLAADARPRLAKVMDGAGVTLDEATQALEDVRQMAGRLSDTLSVNGPIRNDLDVAAHSLERAALAIADLAEFLKRNPNALLSGRRPPEN